MGTFLQIVLAVIVVIALLIAGGWWLVKRWFRRLVGEISAASALLDPRWMQPARTRLRRTSDLDTGQALAALWSQLGRLGFRPLAEFVDDHDAFAAMKVAIHPEARLAAAVFEDDEEQA